MVFVVFKVPWNSIVVNFFMLLRISKLVLFHANEEVKNLENCLFNFD